MSLRAAATTRTGVSASGSRCRDGRSCASGTRSRWPAGPTTSAASPSIAAIVPCTPSPGASTGSPAASGPVSGSGWSSDLIARSARTARSDAAPSRRSRSGSSRRLRRAILISSRSASSSARAVASSRDASAAARSRSAAAEALTAAISASSSRSRSRALPASRAASACSSSASVRSCGRAALCGLGLREQLLDPEPLGGDPSLRVGDDSRVEAEPLGDLERVRDARPSQREPIQRFVGVEVERRRRVRRPVRRARPFLQLGVVRRHDRQARLLGELRQECLRQRGALDRIRAAGHLVEQDERPVSGRAQDLDEIGDVTREGREAHLDRLPVADVREHLVEHRQRSGVRRRAQP